MKYLFKKQKFIIHLLTLYKNNYVKFITFSQDSQTDHSSIKFISTNYNLIKLRVREQ
jgi:hypothetical protein